MPFELSINLEYAFQEAGERIEDRIAAAASAGFSKVELFLLKDRDLPSIASALKQNNVELISTVADYVTQLVDPDTHEEFCDIFRKAAQDAKALGCQNVVVTSGRGVPWMKRPAQLGIFAEALRRLVPIAEELDVIILLESANTRVDHPGVLCSMTMDSVEVARMVGSDRVRVLYDLYHSVAEGEDPSNVLPQIIDLVDHIQIADAPGRGEPGTGAIDWQASFRLFDAVGYEGTIGIECQPKIAPTSDAMDYVQRLASAC